MPTNIDIKEKVTGFPESKSGRIWLFYLSLAAASFTIAASLQKLRK